MKWTFGQPEGSPAAKHIEALEYAISLNKVVIEGLRSELAEAYKDRNFYRDELFKLKGIGTKEEVHPVENNQQPLETRSEPWNVRKRRLEREDRIRAAKLEADDKERYWKEKNAKVEGDSDAIQ